MPTQRELVIHRLDKHGSSMRRFLAGILKADTLLARALLGIFLSCLVAERVLTDPLETVASETATPAVPTCDHAEDIVLYQSMPSSWATPRHQCDGIRHHFPWTIWMTRLTSQHRLITRLTSKPNFIENALQRALP